MQYGATGLVVECTCNSFSQLSLNRQETLSQGRYESFYAVCLLSTSDTDIHQVCLTHW